MSEMIKTPEYKTLITDIKSKIQTSQIKAALKVNEALLRLYWDLAEMIVQKQKDASWGVGLIGQISKDLKEAFPNMKGFSKRNLELMRQWYLFYSNAKQLVSQIDSEKAQQVVAQIEGSKVPQAVEQIFQIPWGHNIAIVAKVKEISEALYYVDQTKENNWSRAVLVHQIESGLYERDGKAITNFTQTLPAPQSDLAKQTLKDPYVLDFLNLRAKHDEREFEDGLIEHISHFLLELGTGFSYMGKQYQLEIGEDEFFMDLLFYHVRLHCYVVVELKTEKFKPAYAGRLNFYISAVDGTMKSETDHPTIGMLICKSKNDTVVEYALKGVDNPIGVSEYTITKELPENLKSSLPSIESIEAELEIDET